MCMCMCSHDHLCMHRCPCMCSNKFSVHRAPIHALTKSSLNMIMQASLLICPCVCVSMHRILRAYVHVPPWSYVLVVAVYCVYLLFCSAYQCITTTTKIFFWIWTSNYTKIHLYVMTSINLNPSLNQSWYEILMSLLKQSNNSGCIRNH